MLNFGIFDGRFDAGAIMYYTIQSNILGLVLFGMLIFCTMRDLIGKGINGSAGYFARFEFVCTIGLLLTFVVYWVLLAPQLFQMTEGYSVWSFGNISVHLIAPLACLVDYVLFTKSKNLKYGDIYLVLIFPLSYMVFASIAGALGYVYGISAVDGLPVHYPYFFLDYDRIGLGFIAYVLGLVVFFLIIGHLMYLFDQKVKKPVLLGRASTHPHIHLVS